MAQNAIGQNFMLVQFLARRLSGTQPEPFAVIHKKKRAPEGARRYESWIRSSRRHERIARTGE